MGGGAGRASGTGGVSGGSVGGSGGGGSSVGGGGGRGVAVGAGVGADGARVELGDSTLGMGVALDSLATDVEELPQAAMTRVRHMATMTNGGEENRVLLIEGLATGFLDGKQSRAYELGQMLYRMIMASHPGTGPSHRGEALARHPARQ